MIHDGKHFDPQSVKRAEATAARQATARQATLAQDAQDELILRGADAQALLTVRHDLDKYKSKVREAEESITQVNEEIGVLRATQTDTLRQYREEAAAAAQRLVDLQQQNNLLHEQLSVLSSQLSSVQLAVDNNQSFSESFSARLQGDAEDESEQPNAEHLLEVIHYLRKEKEITDAKCEVLAAESTRVRAQKDTLEKQCGALREQLGNEREFAKLTAASAVQHTDFMRKVESLNLLQNSNKLLRGEHDGLVGQLAVAERRVQSLDGDLTLLQASNRDLAATKGTLEMENTALQAEIEQWKVHTNYLIEQYNKINPEEMKRLVAERQELTKQIINMKKATEKLSSDLYSCNAELESMSKQSGELEAWKSENEPKLSQLTTETDKNKETINQLRAVGRKYRAQAEATKKELETLKESAAADDTQSKLETAMGEVETLKGELGSRDRYLEDKMTQILATNVELGTLRSTADMQEQEAIRLNGEIQLKREEVDTLTKELEERATKAEESFKTADAELTKLKNQNTALRTQKESAEQQLTAKVAELSEVKEILDAKMGELSEAELGQSALESQFESKLTALEGRSQEGSEVEETARLRTENSELAVKISQLQNDSAKPPTLAQRAALPVQPVRSQNARMATVQQQRESEAVVQPTQSVQPVSLRVEIEDDAAPAGEDTDLVADGGVEAVSPLTQPAPGPMSPPMPRTSTARQMTRGLPTPRPGTSGTKRPLSETTVEERNKRASMASRASTVVLVEHETITHTDATEVMQEGEADDAIDLGYPQQNPRTVYSNSQAAISIAKTVITTGAQSTLE